MRKDIFSGRWVIVGETDRLPSSEFRLQRFLRETAFCPFCERGAEKERCIYCDEMRQELKDQSRLIAENADIVAFAPFASRFPPDRRS